MEMTATFKQKKIDLAKQGFDPGAIGEPIYFNDPAAKAFVRIDAALYQRICSGEVRL
jgi:fatty-acyl-CoA synthase